MCSPRHKTRRGHRIHPGRHLYLQVYLAIVFSLVLVVLMAGAFWWLGSGVSPARQAFEMAGELAAAALPPPEAPVEVQRQAIQQLGSRLRTDLALYDADHLLVAAAGQALPPPRHRETGAWLHGPGGPAWAVALPDGRWLVARAPGWHHHPALGLVLFLGTIALAVAIGAHPIARRLTRRLERLQAGVTALGAGDLSTRVKVEGRDEVAALAESFNRAAARIEELVAAHKMLLANASHELRTPLSRIRLGVELLRQSPDPAREAELARDIAELDRLIDEILLMSRLDAVGELESQEEVDLLGLAAEECARYEDCALEGEAVTVKGDARLLRRLIRNLLDNAERHGKPPITVTVRAQESGAALTVADSGQGIPEAERGQAFTPFHRIAGPEGKGGAGLGLALVRQIARRHGGEAVLAPTPDAPSRILVTLPRMRAVG